MFGWLILIFAAVGLTTLTARTARERGRNGPVWATLSVAAGVAGLVLGFVIVARAMRDAAADPMSSSGFVIGILATLLAPIACMLAIFVLALRMKEIIPYVSGTEWAVHRFSTRDTPGTDCVLSIENKRLRLGDQLTIDAKDIVEIAADGECLRVSWAGGSMLLIPRDRVRAPRERVVWSRGLCVHLRKLLELAPPP